MMNFLTKIVDWLVVPTQNHFWSKFLTIETGVGFIFICSVAAFITATIFSKRIRSLFF